MSTKVMERLNASLEGRYHVERELGEGGMAMVYLADDLKHKRKVAFKVLKSEVANVIGADRFLAEIKTTANLQHPHILPLFDSGEADGLLFYVMPFMEGESLQQKLKREKQLPIEEAIGIATSVASALQHAHDRGVIHRDINPANILIQDGQAVVADFGIALVVDTVGSDGLTQVGVTLGTPHYMSPEQATGEQKVGPRSDIYSLACVLYEMLVGGVPYFGITIETVLDMLMRGTLVAPIERRQTIPSNVDAAIRCALERVPADRFADAQDFATALVDSGFRHGEEATTRVLATGGPWKAWAIIMSALSLVLGVGFGWSLLRPGPSQPVSRLELPLPAGMNLAVTRGHKVTVSPDGSSIVFVGSSPGGEPELWHRPLDQLSAFRIPGTEGANTPRFSPDGQSIVFSVVLGGRDRAIRIVSLDDTPPATLLSAGISDGSLAWGRDGMIYFTNSDRGLSRVSANGGEPEVVTALGEGEAIHLGPEVLPNGTGVLFTRGTNDPANYEIAVVSLETGVVRALVQGATARYAPSGHIIYASREGRLYAAPFDLERLEVTGAASPLVEDIATATGEPGSSQFALSENGVLVYLPGATASAGTEMVWVTRAGNAAPVDPDWQFNAPAENYAWSISPDGARVALTHEVGGNVDIWIKQLPNGPFERLTFSTMFEGNPVWTSGGQFVTYVRGEPGTAESYDAWRRRADGGGEPELVLDDSRGLFQPDWTNNGEWIVFRTPTFGAPGGGDSGERDILGFRLGVDSAATPLIATAEFEETGPALSPNGRWLAYSSDETGQEEVYVRPFPDVESGRVPISIDGGRHPQWAHSGDELFFMDGTQRLLAAQVETNPEFRVVGIEPLFALGAQFLVPSDAGDDFYEVAPDDQAFLMARPAGSTPGFVVVQNFFEELNRLAPPNSN